MAEILEFNEMFYTDFEPSMKNQFIMEIDGVPSYMIKTAAKPNISFDVIDIDHMNLKRKLKGKADWQPIDITMYDPITPSGQQIVMEWVRLSHESLTGRDGYSSMYKKDIDLYQLDPLGAKVSSWKLKGAWISSFNPGDNDWGAGEAVEMTVTLTYDYAILEF